MRQGARQKTQPPPDRRRRDGHAGGHHHATQPAVGVGPVGPVQTPIQCRHHPPDHHHRMGHDAEQPRHLAQQTVEPDGGEQHQQRVGRMAEMGEQGQHGAKMKLDPNQRQPGSFPLAREGEPLL